MKHKPRNLIALIAISGALFAASVSSAPKSLAGPARRGVIPLMGKPGAPIEVSYSVTPPQPVPGKTANVALTIKSLGSGSAVRLKISGSSNLLLSGGELNRSVPALSLGESFSHTVLATPRTGGAAYLVVEVEGVFDGQVTSRTVSVPVFQAAPSQFLGKVKTAPDGEAVISMPAGE